MHQPSRHAESQPSMPFRFDRNEFAGAFGDIGTDLPLIIGMILAAGLDCASVLVMFGLMQIFTAFVYRLPMPVQPLKIVAVIVITQKIGGNIIYGAGLAIGALMLLLTITGLLDWIARIVPKCVVRGIQFGLGLKLALLALKDYVPAEGVLGYTLAAAAFILTLFLLGNRRYPPALFVIALGAIFAFAFKLDGKTVIDSIGFDLPKPSLPSWHDIFTGFIILALPQVPLSIGNSVLAAQQTLHDLFPNRQVGIRKISLTYSTMNLISPLFGGIPACHGSGGIAGHYAFGARTGASVLMYGMFYLGLGFFFSSGFSQVTQVFPLPILGVILLFEGLTLILLIRDAANAKRDLFLAVIVGLISAGLEYGFVISIIIGTILFYWLPVRNDHAAP